MKSIDNVINLVQANVYMASFDLKDAFSSETVHVDDKKFINSILIVNFSSLVCQMDKVGFMT